MQLQSIHTQIQKIQVHWNHVPNVIVEDKINLAKRYKKTISLSCNHLGVTLH